MTVSLSIILNFCHFTYVSDGQSVIYSAIYSLCLSIRQLLSLAVSQLNHCLSIRLSITQSVNRLFSQYMSVQYRTVIQAVSQYLSVGKSKKLIKQSRQSILVSIYVWMYVRHVFPSFRQAVCHSISQFYLSDCRSVSLSVIYSADSVNISQNIDSVNQNVNHSVYMPFR